MITMSREMLDSLNAKVLDGLDDADGASMTIQAIQATALVEISESLRELIETAGALVDRDGFALRVAAMVTTDG